MLKYYAVCLTLLIALGGVMLYKLLPEPIQPVAVKEDPLIWSPPDIATLINLPESGLILYGKELFQHTSKYLGPKGTIAVMSNGMNCENCHIKAGTNFNGFSLSAVAANYPKYRSRSGVMESVEYRVNECFVRSLNGKRLDSLSREMRAITAYIKWLGKDVPKNMIPKGAGIPPIDIMNRAANPVKGWKVYVDKCLSCHGDNGQGILNTDSTGYTYPPLWGEHSYNVSAGIFRISSFAAFVKYNMPYKPEEWVPRLADEDAWDVAAFVNSQKRPVKFFKEDWPKIETKPFDFPFGPFADTFPQAQHKYGPFTDIKKIKKQGS